MFYSHEILTSREGGVATVWLVATLGSKSNLKKVNRKAILEVDVGKTCQIIITPEAPMALRLQSNLLYGVSRVYSQQCGYVLTDVQTAQSNMRALLKAVRTSALDPEAGKARPDQLILQDDPAFVFDMAFHSLDLDLSALDPSTDESSRRSSILSPHSQRTSISSAQGSQESPLGLVIPSSSLGGGGDLGGFVLPGDDRSSAQRSARMRSILDEDEGGFDLDPGFNFDADGNIVVTGEGTPLPGSAARPSAVRLGSDSAASAWVRQEIEDGMQAGQIDLGDEMNLDLDLDLPMFEDDDETRPPAEPFPPMAPEAPTVPGFLRSSSEAPQEESSESAEAPARRRPRAPKVLGMDQQKSLRNADLASWNNNYLANMAEATRLKQQHKALTLAKKNAYFWVYGAGINGIGAISRRSNVPNPLDMFAGDSLVALVTGTALSTAGRKRSHTEGEDHETESEARRVRMRDTDDDQFGRGDDLILPDDDTMGLPIDDNIEIGRHAPPALEDHSSQMPWNLSASLHGGSRAGSTARTAPFNLHPQSSLGGGFPTSAGQSSSLRPGSLDRPRSRLTSASPLVGRGRERFSSIDLPIPEDEIHAGADLSSLGGIDDFQLYGPAAGVTTQEAAESQWMRATLDAESGNFLEFVRMEIAAKPKPITTEGVGDELAADAARAKPSTFFEELLPPEKHTKTVAAQGLLHVLALATKGLLHVQQDEDYGPIAIDVFGGL